jgi:hypothetical protein
MIIGEHRVDGLGADQTQRIRDDRHEHRERSALAEARGDEVGDRSHFIGASDLHETLEERQCRQIDQRRTDVDGQVGPTFAHGRTDGAVEGP